MTLVDTSSWIHFLRRGGKEAVKKRVRDALADGSAVTCPVILAELWMGAASEKDRKDVQELQDVLHCLPIEQETWKLAYQLARSCCANGTPVPSTDLIIAACAFFHGASIETEDKHFALLQRYYP